MHKGLKKLKDNKWKRMKMTSRCSLNWIQYKRLTKPWSNLLKEKNKMYELCKLSKDKQREQNMMDTL
jgi:hypothetical protein